MTQARRLPRPFTAEEQARLWPVLKQRPELYWSCVFLNETGLRVSEFAAITRREASTWPELHWWNLRSKAVCRFVGKGDVERLVPLTKRAVRASQELLRTTRAGDFDPTSRQSLLPWSIRGFNYVLNQAGERAGVHVTAHRFRHTALTRWLNAGANEYVVADLAGHLEVATLRHYAALNEKRLRKAMR